MRVLFLVADIRLVSCRFRVMQWLPHLRHRNIEPTVADLHVPPRQRRAAIAHAVDYDAVVVHRALLRWSEVRLLRQVAPRYVFDFDDALMFRDTAARRGYVSWQRQMRFARMVRDAGHVVAGNRYLAEQTAPHQPRVTIIPTTVDLAQYPIDSAGAREAVVGWIGTRVNLTYVEALAAPLARLATENPAMRVKIVSDGTSVIPGVPVIAKPWSAGDELDDLRSFRVGIMPLPDDPWTRGKCAVKILQYMAAGVPVVCSPVGANTDVVVDGRNGYFARSDDDWVRCIGSLLNDPARCRELGAAGRRTVEERFSVTAQLDRFVSVLAAVSSGR
jgi:glycosyltransferase involved in cell wall biosynthesis